MKKALVSIFCILALGLASLFTAQIGDSFAPQTQEQNSVQQITVGLDSASASYFSWSFTGTSLSAPSSAPTSLNQRTNISPSPSSYFWVWSKDRHSSQLCGVLYHLDQGSNFVAFRHNNQPRYYIFDLHRIRV